MSGMETITVLRCFWLFCSCDLEPRGGMTDKAPGSLLVGLWRSTRLNFSRATAVKRPQATQHRAVFGSLPATPATGRSSHQVATADAAALNRP
jgi:hypothetical protein